MDTVFSIFFRVRRSSKRIRDRKRQKLQLLELLKSKKSDSNDTFDVSEVNGNSSDDFIDDTLEDSSTSDSDMYTKLLNDEEDYNTIINKLKRNTEKDRENKEKRQISDTAQKS